MAIRFLIRRLSLSADLTHVGRWSALLLLALTMGIGCQAFDYIPPRHELEPKPTAVLVDDPRQLMGTPLGASMIGEQIRRDLIDQAELEQVIPTRRIDTLRQDLGDAYPTTPVDVVGRKLGVNQVVHVLVEKVTWNVNEFLARPSATVRVRVIDVDQARRVFPLADARIPANDVGRLSIEFPAPMRVDVEDRSDEALVQRELARQIGRHVARLFYKYHLRDKI